MCGKILRMIWNRTKYTTVVEQSKKSLRVLNSRLKGYVEHANKAIGFDFLDVRDNFFPKLLSELPLIKLHTTQRLTFVWKKKHL